MGDIQPTDISMFGIYRKYYKKNVNGDINLQSGVDPLRVIYDNPQGDSHDPIGLTDFIDYQMVYPTFRFESTFNDGEYLYPHSNNIDYPNQIMYKLDVPSGEFSSFSITNDYQYRKTVSHSFDGLVYDRFKFFPKLVSESISILPFGNTFSVRLETNVSVSVTPKPDPSLGTYLSNRCRCSVQDFNISQLDSTTTADTNISSHPGLYSTLINNQNTSSINMIDNNDFYTGTDLEFRTNNYVDSNFEGYFKGMVLYYMDYTDNDNKTFFNEESSCLCLTFTMTKFTSGYSILYTCKVLPREDIDKKIIKPLVVSNIDYITPPNGTVDINNNVIVVTWDGSNTSFTVGFTVNIRRSSGDIENGSDIRLRFEENNENYLDNSEPNIITLSDTTNSLGFTFGSFDFSEMNNKKYTIIIEQMSAPGGTPDQDLYVNRSYIHLYYWYNTWQN